MRKNLIILALVGLLAACTNAGTGATDESSAPVSTPTASGGATDTGASTGDASAACSEAFAPIADMGIESTSDLGDLQDEVSATIQSCESVDDWIAGANEVVANGVQPGSARLLLGIRCDDPNLSNTPICEEL